ncbi:MAG: hypothetical protein KF838_01560 [Phycisphaeraceae bacterium]|nr:MAG: hypothetical protein KF838_01560 [Phycisphaeraceae bacterium]
MTQKAREHEEQQHPGRREAEVRGSGHREGDEHHADLRDDDQGLAIDAVGDKAAEHAEDERRAELRGGEVPHPRLGLGLLRDDPADGDELEPAAEVGAEGRDEDGAVVGVAEYAKTRGTGRRGRDGGDLFELCRIGQEGAGRSGGYSAGTVW